MNALEVMIPIYSSLFSEYFNSVSRHGSSRRPRQLRSLNLQISIASLEEEEVHRVSLLPPISPKVQTSTVLAVKAGANRVPDPRIYHSASGGQHVSSMLNFDRCHTTPSQVPNVSQGAL